mgnify:CR=1 FL=1
MSDTQPKKIDRSVSLFWTNVIAIVAALPIFGVTYGLFTLIWGAEQSVPTFSSAFPLIFFAVLLGGTVVHELLHGVTWQLVGKLPQGTIEYGIKWKMLTPYAHAKAPMPVRPYRWGTFMPGLVLGLLPAGIAILTGNAMLLFFGTLFTWMSAGDFLILWMIRDAGNELLVEDHPTRAGCYLISSGSNGE